MTERMVRMGELAASATPGDVLVALGLGSCIGLALVDARRGVAGLAHVVLPANEGHASQNPLKFADRAVPELVQRVVALGALRPRLEAALVGGAGMFPSTSSTMEVGCRNDAAVRAQLRELRIPLAAAATGGSRGRTVKVDVATGRVSFREAGGLESDLLVHPETIGVPA